MPAAIDGSVRQRISPLSSAHCLARRRCWHNGIAVRPSWRDLRRDPIHVVPAFRDWWCSSGCGHDIRLETTRQPRLGAAWTGDLRHCIPAGLMGRGFPGCLAAKRHPARPAGQRSESRLNLRRCDRKARSRRPARCRKPRRLVLLARPASGRGSPSRPGSFGSSQDQQDEVASCD